MLRVLAAGFACSSVFSIVSELFTSSSPAAQCIVSGGYYGCDEAPRAKRPNAPANPQELVVLSRRLKETFEADSSEDNAEAEFADQVDTLLDSKCEDEEMSEEECEEWRRKVKLTVETAKTQGPLIMMMIVLLLTLLIGLSCAPCVCGLLYYSGVTARKKQLFPASPELIPADLSLATVIPQDFRYPLSSCTENMPVCCWSFLVPTVRQGDSLEVAGITGFWVPLLVCFAVNIASSFAQDLARKAFGPTSDVPSFLPILASLASAAIYAFWRGRLRERLGGPKMEYNQQFAVDTAIHCCCHPCAVAQEARQVDDATGTELHCGCGMGSKGNPPLLGGNPMVGTPVAVAGNVAPQPAGMQMAGHPAPSNGANKATIFGP